MRRNRGKFCRNFYWLKKTWEKHISMWCGTEVQISWLHRSPTTSTKTNLCWWCILKHVTTRVCQRNTCRLLHNIKSSIQAKKLVCFNFSLETVTAVKLEIAWLTKLDFETNFWLKTLVHNFSTDPQQGQKLIPKLALLMKIPGEVPFWFATRECKKLDLLKAGLNQESQQFDDLNRNTSIDLFYPPQRDPRRVFTIPRS